MFSDGAFSSSERQFWRQVMSSPIALIFSGKYLWNQAAACSCRASHSPWPCLLPYVSFGLSPSLLRGDRQCRRLCSSAQGFLATAPSFLLCPAASSLLPVSSAPGCLFHGRSPQEAWRASCPECLPWPHFCRVPFHRPPPVSLLSPPVSASL